MTRRGDGTHHISAADNCPEYLVASRGPSVLTLAYSSTWPFMMLRRAAVPRFGGNSNINLHRKHLRAERGVTFQGNPTITRRTRAVVASSSPPRSRSTVMPPSTIQDVPSERCCLTASMCSWCNDEKARSARRRGVGILPCRRAAFHIDVRHLRSGTLCNHHAVVADARECWCSGNHDRRLLHKCRNQENSPTCTGDPLPSVAAKKAVAPFLYAGGLTPTLNYGSGATALTVTASQPGFTMLMPIWGTALNAPSASTSIPF